ncbi:CDGSH iron-sulfur domain-containing protein [bacterium]|nr:CDGSH iron-sulfur domain-containing protein [bacterium]
MTNTPEPNKAPEPIIVAKKCCTEKLYPGKYHYCTCGHSKDQPFCDGTHPEGFEPKRFKIDEPKQVYLCLCKHTKNAPYCDGTHSHI